MTASIEVKELSKHYGFTKAVNDISFTVAQGEIVGFLGPNGAGKSTTMKVLTSYIAPTKGRALIAGKDVVHNSLQTRREIGYLPESNPLYTDMMVRDYLVFVAEMRAVPASQRAERVRTVGGRCGLGKVAGKYISELSKGYRQRVGLAQAMMHNPNILILDEPTSGLDPNQIIEIRELIKEIGQEKTVILSTHILPEVQATCGRVLIINDGKIVADGSPDDLSKKAGGVRVNVELRAPRDAARAVLTSVAGVKDLREAPPNGTPENCAFTLHCSEGTDPREAVFRAAVQNDWVLMGLSMESVSLEEVFRKLTTN